MLHVCVDVVRFAARASRELHCCCVSAAAAAAASAAASTSVVARAVLLLGLQLLYDVSTQKR
jgi:hypothetical protein